MKFDMHEACFAEAALLIENLATLIRYIADGLPVNDWLQNALNTNFDNMMESCFPDKTEVPQNV